MQAEGGLVASDVIKNLRLTENLKEAMEDVFYVQVSCSIIGGGSCYQLGGLTQTKLNYACTYSNNGHTL